MIKLEELRPEDKLRPVRYTSTFGDKIEDGVISSWNHLYVFVHYWSKWSHLFRATAEATDPNDLDFIDMKVVECPSCHNEPELDNCCETCNGAGALRQ